MPDPVLAAIDRTVPVGAVLGTIRGGAAALVSSLGLVTGRSIAVAEPGPAGRCADSASVPGPNATDAIGARPCGQRAGRSRMLGPWSLEPGRA